LPHFLEPFAYTLQLPPWGIFVKISFSVIVFALHKNRSISLARNLHFPIIENVKTYQVRGNNVKGTVEVIAIHLWQGIEQAEGRLERLTDPLVRRLDVLLDLENCKDKAY